ncbi:MAG: hypothetical protein LW595_06770, partial [Rickettsiales bacterium]|nr:hypothetical protein [Rickettsiales bacterium]
SQRNKYDESGNKNEGKNRAGNSYEVLKTTLKTLNNNINFTTESLKLFNVDNKETLKNDKEKHDLIKEKALFMRAMRSADINNFALITKDSLGVNEPSNNILLEKPDGVAPKSIRVKLMQLKSEINKQ